MDLTNSVLPEIKGLKRPLVEDSFFKWLLSLLHHRQASLYFVNFCELEQGRKLEEIVAIDVKHSVSTCFEQGRLGEEKSLLMSTSHKLDANNMLTTQYVNDLEGGEEFTCNTSHSILPVSRLSTCFHSASVRDPTLEVELEQENKSWLCLRNPYTSVG